MSMESAKAFIERMKTDEDFRNKVNECKDQETRMAFVKHAGFNFTKDDLDLAKAELSDDVVSDVSGGALCPIDAFICKYHKMFI